MITKMGLYLDIELIILIFLIVLQLTLSRHGDCSSFYGRRCPFVPAPSGKTPSCARPGLTFCENPDGYPGGLIMQLASEARYNHQSLVTDETKDEFSATKGPYPAAKYSTSYKEIDITTSSPQSNVFTWHNSGLVPPRNFSENFFNSFGSHQDESVSQNRGQFLRYKYTSNIPQPPGGFFGPSQDQMSQSQYRTNYLWKRSADMSAIHERVKRNELSKYRMKEIRESPFKKNFTGQIHSKRSKRQNEVENEGILCSTRSTFVMPRAGMNAQGDWMYIVNMENSNNKYTQLVRSEVCISQTCSKLCGVPQGFVSKCEQKYIQKRLMALQPGGDQLYTDIFWIPSCCICTIQKI